MTKNPDTTANEHSMTKNPDTTVNEQYLGKLNVTSVKLTVDIDSDEILPDYLKTALKWCKQWNLQYLEILISDKNTSVNDASSPLYHFNNPTESKIEVQGPSGKRTIEAKDFFEGIYTTVLEDDEIITSIRVPKTNNGVYLKFFQSASRFAVVGCAAVKNGSGVRVGLTGVADAAYRAEGVENAFSGDAEAAAEHAVDGVEVLEDHFASSEYRSHLAKVYVKRALKALN